jgi:hypothetical protein
MVVYLIGGDNVWREIGRFGLVVVKEKPVSTPIQSAPAEPSIDKYSSRPQKQMARICRPATAMRRESLRTRDRVSHTAGNLIASALAPIEALERSCEAA